MFMAEDGWSIWMDENAGVSDEVRRIGVHALTYKVHFRSQSGIKRHKRYDPAPS